MALTNLFTTAKVVPAKETSKPKDKKIEANIPGLATYAKIVAAEKAIAALKATFKVQIDTEITDEFIAQGARYKKQPENFRGIDGTAKASCELRKRSSASPLTPAQIALLDEYSIEHEKVEDVKAAYIFNPVYKDDQVLLGKISTALQKIPGVPGDLIMLQEGKSKEITTENSLDQVFQNSDQDVIRALLEVCGVIGVKPTVANLDAAEALKDLAAMITPEEEEEEEADADEK